MPLLPFHFTHWQYLFPTFISLESVWNSWNIYLVCYEEKVILSDLLLYFMRIDNIFSLPFWSCLQQKSKTEELESDILHTELR